MKKLIFLDEKTIELSGVAASVACGCRPYLDFHFKKAMEVGCTHEQNGDELLINGIKSKKLPVVVLDGCPFNCAEVIMGRSTSVMWASSPWMNL